MRKAHVVGRYPLRDSIAQPPARRSGAPSVRPLLVVVVLVAGGHLRRALATNKHPKSVYFQGKIAGAGFEPATFGLMTPTPLKRPRNSRTAPTEAAGPCPRRALQRHTHT